MFAVGSNPSGLQWFVCTLTAAGGGAGLSKEVACLLAHSALARDYELATGDWQQVHPHALLT